MLSPVLQGTQISILWSLSRCDMVDYREILLSEIQCIPCSLLLCWLKMKEDLLAVWDHVFQARTSPYCSELYAQYNHNCTMKLSLTLQGPVHQIKLVSLMRTDCCSWRRHLRRNWDMDQWFLCIVLLLKSPKSISRCLCSLGVTVLHLSLLRALLNDFVPRLYWPVPFLPRLLFSLCKGSIVSWRLSKPRCREHHLVNHPRPIVFFLDVLFTIVPFCEFLALKFLSLVFGDLSRLPSLILDLICYPGFCLLSTLSILLWSLVSSCCPGKLLLFTT